MTTDTDCAEPPLLKVRGPGDLAQAVPYLLGFHPSRSLVLVGLERKRVTVTARIDLDDLADSADPGVLPRTVAAMVRSGVTKFVAIVYDDGDPDPNASLPAGPDGALIHGDLAAAVHRVVEECGAAADDVALVSRGRLWSYDCENPDCCPPEGRLLESGSVIAAEAAFAGMVALPDRGSLIDTFTPTDERDSPRLADAIRDAERAAVAAIVADTMPRVNRSDVRALFAAARVWDVPGADPDLDPAQVARFGVALRRYDVRDPVWMGIDDERIDGRALWRRLATTLPPPYDAAPLFLFAWASYRAGNGALANVAALRALDSDPEYSAADLVLAAISNAIDPRRLRRLRGSSRAARAAAGAKPRPLRATPPAAPRGAADRRRR
jgi:Domain of unknown function (DUF4192)